MNDIFRKIPYINIFLFFITLITTLLAGVYMEGGNILSFRDIKLGIPFSFTLLTILGFHEFGHYFYAKKNKIKVSLPYFIPAPTFIGTFGALIKIKSPITTKKALLEIGASGPIAGFLVTIPLLVYGLSMSTVVEIYPDSGIILGEPLLMKFFTFLIFPNLSESQDIILHPIGFASWIGLLITMLNLLPIGQLDGGHIAYAVFGKHHQKISKIVFIFLIPLSFLSLNWILWGILIIILMRTLKHPPILDVNTVLTFREKIIGFVCLLIFIVSFIPVPFEI
tara:strand:- start:31598 stop:32437 length:840 start_codon:yes stop_codon:yes gene_type:complete